MKDSRHLLILIGGHLANAPRPQKEAKAAREAGFRVSIRGTWHDDLLAMEDLQIAREIDADIAPLIDLRKPNLASLVARVQGKMARGWWKLSGIATAPCFGLSTRWMAKEARRLRPDLIMVHSEGGLWAGNRLLSEGFHVGVDFEDWFSEDLPLTSRSSRPVSELKRLEHAMLHHASPVFTTTENLARELAKEAGCRRHPTTIPNAFPATASPSHSSRADLVDRPLRFYWFSQTIGPGRGLEFLAGALEGVPGHWELHLRGNLRSYRDWFDSTFANLESSRVILHPPVPNRELSAASACFDVGLALETPDYPNHDLTASNKIFEYMRSGLAIVATATAGQEEVMDAMPEMGWLVSPTSTEDLRRTLCECLTYPGKVTKAAVAAKRASESVWAWERFAPRLQQDLLASCP